MIRPTSCLLIFLLSTFGALSAHAQITARQVFAESPDYVFPALSSDIKQQLLSLYDNYVSSNTDLNKSTVNLMGGKSEITSITDSLLEMRLDENTQMQLKLLSMVNNTVLISLVITSTPTPAQSVVLFYGMDWMPVKSDRLFRPPVETDFARSEVEARSTAFKNALVERGAWSYAASYATDQPVLTLRVSEFDDPAVKRLHPTVPALLKKEGLMYKWNGATLAPLHR